MTQSNPTIGDSAAKPAFNTGVVCPNYAGRSDVDAEVAAELAAAGIPAHYFPEVLRDNTRSEVKTIVVGTLRKWSFQRAWRYWIAKGPGIEVVAAEQLHKDWGQYVRVDGHCGCPSPREWFGGLACGHYHVDSVAGLRALADTIKQLTEKFDYEDV